jgi:hypothetical protein
MFCVDVWSAQAPREQPFLHEVPHGSAWTLSGKEVVIGGQNRSIHERQSVPRVGCNVAHQGSPSSYSLAFIMALLG